MPIRAKLKVQGGHCEHMSYQPPRYEQLTDLAFFSFVQNFLTLAVYNFMNCWLF